MAGAACAALMAFAGVACSQPASTCDPWNQQQLAGSATCALVIEATYDSVRDVAYSPNGQVIAMTEFYVQERDAATGEPLTECGECDSLKLPIYHVAFDREGKAVAIASGVGLWLEATPTGETYSLTKAEGEEVYPLILDLAYVPAMDALLVGYDDGIAWVSRSGQEIAKMSLGQAVYGTAVAPDEATYSVALADGTVLIQPFDQAARGRVLNGDQAPTALAYRQDSEVLAVANESGQVTLWRVDDGTPILTMAAHEDLVTSLEFSPDGTRLATGSVDGSARLFSASSGQLLGTWVHPGHQVLDVAFAPDGKRLAAGLSADYEFEETGGEQATPGFRPGLRGWSPEATVVVRAPGKVIVWGIDASE